MYLINNYRYTSLPELNALLKLYNITADRGTENSRLAKHKRLIYHALDSKRNSVGLSIKASSLYGCLTLKRLETLFMRNENTRSGYKSQINRTIDFAFIGKSIVMLPQPVKALQNEDFDAVIRMDWFMV